MIGIIAILILALATQFAFLMTATWLTILKNRQDIGAQDLQMLIYIAGFIFASITLIPGGFITAYISKTKVITHCAIVGLVATAISLSTAPDSEHATSKGALFIILGTGMVMLGGVLWKWWSGRTSS